MDVIRSGFRGWGRFGTGRRSLETLGMVALILVICACGEKSGREHLADAREALNSSAYTEAISAADAGLLANPDEVSAWGLELVKLEAQARAGLGEDVKLQLDALSDLYPKRITPSEFSSAAQQLKAAGQRPASIEVLDMGSKRYPDDKMIATLLEEALSAEDVSPEELKMLKSLGYIE